MQNSIIQKFRMLISSNKESEPIAIYDAYSAARHEWNERYGSYIQSAKSWRHVGMISLSLATVSFSYALWQSSGVKYVPYIVQVDKLGNSVMAGFPSQIEYADERVIRALLSQWISSFRSVTADGTVQRKYIDITYSMLDLSDPAAFKVTNWMKLNPFEERAKEKSVSVEVTSIVALSKKSYQIDWREIERDRQGRALGTRRHRAIAHVSIVPPQEEMVIKNNPIGLYIRDIDWTTQL